MIIANGKIKKKAYCSNCFSIINWDNAEDETGSFGHRAIKCPVCGKSEDICDDTIIVESGVIETPKAYVNNVAYATTAEALNLLSDGDSIILTENVSVDSLSLNGATVDLGGKTLTTSATITVAGNCVIKNGTLKATSVDVLSLQSGAYVKFEDITVDAGKKGIVADGAEFTLLNCTIASEDEAIVLANGSKVTIDGGSYTTTNAGVIVTDETATNGGNSITIYGGTFTSAITDDGYLPFVIYLSNSDIARIRKGTLSAAGGSAIVIRSGKLDLDVQATVTVSGEGEGQVGPNSEAEDIPAGHDVVIDYKSNYPGADWIDVAASGRDVYALEAEIEETPSGNESTVSNPSTASGGNESTVSSGNESTVTNP